MSTRQEASDTHAHSWTGHIRAAATKSSQQHYDAGTVEDHVLHPTFGLKHKHPYQNFKCAPHFEL